MSSDKGTKKTLVSVSVLAVMMSAPLPANAQMINCPQRIFIGNHIACDSGSLQIKPDGSTVLFGCLISNSAAAAGQCQVWAPGTPTRSVVVTFANNTITLNAGGQTITMKDFRMKENGVPGTNTRLTFSPTEVMNTVTIDIGGTAYFSNNQPQGAYTGNLQIRANFN